MVSRTFAVGDFQQILTHAIIGYDKQLPVAVSLSHQGADGDGDPFRREWAGYREHEVKVRKAPQPVKNVVVEIGLCAGHMAANGRIVFDILALLYVNAEFRIKRSPALRPHLQSHGMCTAFQHARWNME